MRRTPIKRYRSAFWIYIYENDDGSLGITSSSIAKNLMDNAFPDLFERYSDSWHRKIHRKNEEIFTIRIPYDEKLNRITQTLKVWATNANKLL
jgi:hypothetical protein